MRQYLKPLALLFVLLTALPVALAGEVKIGVLAFRPKAITQAQWQPTADYLSQHIPGSHFNIVPMTYDELDQAVRQGTVDFVFTNPAHYVLLRSKAGLNRIVTLVSEENGKALSVFGGAILVRSDRKDINRLTDLKDKRIAYVSRESLGGYQMQALEMQQAGINMNSDIQPVVTDMPHDLSVQAVLAGRADAAFARTGVLEAMIAQGAVAPGTLKVLNGHQVDGFPFALSTDLYPEWPFAVLPHTDQYLAREVASALLALPPDGPVAQAGNYHGWTIANDYLSVSNLLQALHLPPFDAPPKFTLSDIIKRYVVQLTAGLLLIAFLLLMLVLRLRKTGITLNRERSLLNSLVQTIPDLIVMKDLSGRFITVNPTTERLFGRPAHAILGKTDYDFVPKEQADEFRQNDMAALEAQAPLSNEEWLTFSDGNTLLYEMIKSPVRDAEGSLLGTMGIGRNITELKRLQQSLEENQTMLKEAQAIAHLGSWSMDGQTGQLRWSDETYRLFNLPTGSKVDYQTLLSFIPPEDRERVDTAWQNAVKGTAAYRIEHRIVVSGEQRWVLAQAKLERSEDGSLLRATGTVHDITETKLAEQTQRVAAIAFESQEGMIVTDPHGQIIRVNSAFTEVTGYSHEEVIGKNPALLNSGRQDPAFYHAMWQNIAQNGYWAGEIWNRRKNGEIYPEWLTITAVKDSNGIVTNYVGSFTDITQQKAAETQIYNLAFYDPLTGIPNRRLLTDRLQQAQASSARTREHGALIYIDLDNFKLINDTQGHPAGDQLLVEVSRRIRSVIREDDTVGRMGGDEFIVLLEGLPKETQAAAGAAEEVAEKIRCVLEHNYFGDSAVPFHTSCSIGITVFCDHISNTEELFKQADLALYQAKDAGRNTIRFYDKVMQENINRRATLEAGLHRGLAEQEFLLFYQPQVDQLGKLVGAEALLRWQPPGETLVSPALFIPVAESSGLIIEISNWVLQTAMQQLQQWQKNEATRHLTLAVNISVRQFSQPGFVSHIENLLRHYQINPERLKLEMTESLLLTDVTGTITKMNQLKNLGVRFSLDDFGTGYSSLAYLKRFPLDQIKIDQSFVRDIPGDREAEAIVTAIINLGTLLQMDVIAEGVETVEQQAFLHRQGCHQYQGYLFGKPMPIEEFSRLFPGA